MSRYLNEEGLRVVATKVNKKQDSFITGNSLEFITVGQGEIDNLLYLDANNELVTISPQPSIGVDITDPDKALGLANQLLKVETMGFLGGSNVTIVACSPQTPVGAVEGDVIEPTQSEVLFGPMDSFSAEFRKWCETYGLSIQVPMEQSRTLTFYISVPQLSINKALKYIPDDSRTSDENSWSASYTKMQVRALMPTPLVSSETATIEDSSVDTWGRVEGIKDSNEDWIDTYSDVVDGFLLQKFLLSSTGGTELPSMMTVKLRNKEIYYGYFGIEVTCNGIVIGQTVYPENEGSNIFENNVGITWNYWIPGDYTVVFDNSSTASVQKINVTGSEDSEARETAAGAMALAQQAIDNVGPTSFSTSEQDMGKTWIDGKKIYRKCIFNTDESNYVCGDNNTIEISMLGANVADKVIRFDVMLKKIGESIYITANSSWIKDGTIGNNLWCAFDCSLGMTKITSLQNNDAYCISSIVLEYTKTN